MFARYLRQLHDVFLAGVEPEDGAALVYDRTLHKWVSGTNGNSGSQPDVDTATVTTDPSTFDVTHAFDVGAPGVIVFRFALTSVVADGETFGPGPSELGVSFGYQQSPDGSSWGVVVPLSSAFSTADDNGNLSAVGQVFETMFGTLKEGRGQMSLVTGDGSPYAGPNNPTATLLLTYSVITLGSLLT